MPFQEELDKAERAVEIINHKLFAWRPNDRRVADPYVQTARQAIENIQATRAAYDAKRQGFGSAERQIGNNLVMLKDMNAELDRILHEARIIPGPEPKGRPEAVSCFSDDSSIEGGGGGGGMKGIAREGKKIFQKVKKRLSFRGEGGAGGGWRGRGGGQGGEERVVHRLTLQKDFNDPNRYSRVDLTGDRRRPSSSRGQQGTVQGGPEAERKAGKKEKREAKSGRKRRHTLDSSTPQPQTLNIQGGYSNYLADKYNGNKSEELPSSAMHIPRLDGRPPGVSEARRPSPKFPPPGDNSYRRRGGSLGGYSHRPLLDPNIRPPSRSSPTPPPLFNSNMSTSSSSSAAKLSMISARTEALFGRHLQQQSSSSSSPSSSISTLNREGEGPIVRPNLARTPLISGHHQRNSSHGLVYTPLPTIPPLVIRKKQQNSVPPQLATISEEEPVHASDGDDNDGDYSDSVVTDEFSFSDEVFDTHAAGVLEALDRMSGPGIHFDRLRGYDGNSE
ncbi:hypothetical protein B9Z19DRAFT_1173200 [Tuber borchii]|uniref:Uncharacterized protein n=1 Tax=Tuber borchii TaxID=42251 RepID=A0A2T6ZXP8_TUBBO|nr:hypothetical protein B9Z19DRAFT_1173200 [Tuber borchii]